MLARLAVLGAVLGVFVPTAGADEGVPFCVRNVTESYDCNCHQHCEDCQCRPHFGHCDTHCPHDRCWCGRGCRCCGHRCCHSECETCQREVCGQNIFYKVTTLTPSYGPVEGGTVVRVEGGEYSNIWSIKCKFGDKQVDGVLVSTNEIHCVSPPQNQSVRGVPLEVTLDGGQSWTNDGVTFLYHDCAGNGVCSGNGMCHPDSTCTCDPGWYGRGCWFECPGGHNNSCNGHTRSGTCNADGECPCIAGFWGNACENECPGGALTPCNDHGRCLDTGVCDCDVGFVGSACERNGTCVGDECRCQGGYWGPQCQNQCDGGHEMNCNSARGQGFCGINGKCYCNKGYWGDTCENECPGGSQNPCNLRGEQDTCSSQGKCHCQNGYYGTECESECPGGAANPCSGHGTCSSTDGHCLCDSGWAGANCSIPCPGGVTNPCNGRGTCDIATATCTCNSTHFYGSACEGICPCDGKGLCDSNGKCQCFHGYFGDTCQLQCPGENAPCSSIPGQDPHGRCVEGNPPRCECLPGYWGTSCQHECPGGKDTPCHGNGICSDSTGKCQCNPNFEGEACETRLCPYNCNGNGQCENGECKCNDGFVPPFCDTPEGPVINVSKIHGKIGFYRESIEVDESVEELVLTVGRLGGSEGNVSANVEFRDITTVQGLDYWGLSGQSLYWNDGDVSDRNVSLTIIQDADPEDDEYFNIVLTGIEGGAMMGNVSSILVTIKSSTITSDEQELAVSIRFHTTLAVTDIPPLSKERADFINQFEDDIARFTNIDRRRAEIKQIDTTLDHKAIVELLLLPSGATNKNRGEMSALASHIISLAANESSPLYTQGAMTQFVDIQYAPEVHTSYRPPPSGGSSSAGKKLSPGAIAGIVIGSLVGAGVLAASIFYCYLKRTKIVEWLLWKLGNFRFNNLKEARYDVDVPESELEGKNQSVIESKNGSEMNDVVGEEAPDSMPLPDDF